MKYKNRVHYECELIKLKVKLCIVNQNLPLFSYTRKKRFKYLVVSY